MMENLTNVSRKNHIKHDLNLSRLKFENPQIKQSPEINKNSQIGKASESKIIPIKVSHDRPNNSASLGDRKPVVNQKSKQDITVTLRLLHPSKSILIQNWRFEKALNIWIGRSSNNHVVLRSCVVSRHHLELRQLDGKWILTSFGSNGTYVNGKKISQVCLEDGAIVHLGRTGPVIQIHLTASSINEEPIETQLQCVG